ncbi:MAG: hypothetical protein V4805_15690 [Pseudomonadota bacterium]
MQLFFSWPQRCLGGPALVAMLFAPAGAQAASVPLTLAQAPLAKSIPVRSGNLEIPAQFNSLSTWPDGSVKSALVKFVADAGLLKTYQLHYGTGVSQKLFAKPDRLQQHGLHRKFNPQLQPQLCASAARRHQVLEIRPDRQPAGQPRIGMFHRPRLWAIRPPSALATAAWVMMTCR